jgi:PAS domain-containing protein
MTLVHPEDHEYFGLTLDEWRDTAPGAVRHPDDSKRVQAIWDRAMSSGSAFEIEVRMRKGDGNYRWFLARYNPVLDDEGKCYVGTLRVSISTTANEMSAAVRLSAAAERFLAVPLSPAGCVRANRAPLRLL